MLEFIVGTGVFLIGASSFWLGRHEGSKEGRALARMYYRSSVAVCKDNIDLVNALHASRNEVERLQNMAQQYARRIGSDHRRIEELEGRYASYRTVTEASHKLLNDDFWRLMSYAKFLEGKIGIETEGKFNTAVLLALFKQEQKS